LAINNSPSRYRDRRSSSTCFLRIWLSKSEGGLLVVPPQCPCGDTAANVLIYLKQENWRKKILSFFFHTSDSNLAIFNCYKFIEIFYNILQIISKNEVSHWVVVQQRPCGDTAGTENTHAIKPLLYFTSDKIVYNLRKMKNGCKQ